MVFDSFGVVLPLLLFPSSCPTTSGLFFLHKDSYDSSYRSILLIPPLLSHLHLFSIWPPRHPWHTAQGLERWIPAVRWGTNSLLITLRPGFLLMELLPQLLQEAFSFILFTPDWREGADLSAPVFKYTNKWDRPSKILFAKIRSVSSIFVQIRVFESISLRSTNSGWVFMRTDSGRSLTKTGWHKVKVTAISYWGKPYILSTFTLPRSK